MNIITLLKARLPVHAGEFDQAFLRVVILAIVFVYLAALSGGQVDIKVLALFGGFLAVAVGMFVAVRTWPPPNVSRRVLGIVFDAAVFTGGLLLLGDHGSILVGMYFFLIFGNGYRFGRIYLHLTQLLSIASLLLVSNLVPWWRYEPMVLGGWLIALVLVPFYVSTLTKLMRDAHAKTERTLKECLEREGRSGQVQFPQGPHNQ